MTHPELSRLLGSERTSDMHRRAAARHQPAADAPSLVAEPAVTLRMACADEAGPLRRLAQLDSAEPLPEPILIGEVSGRLVAALSLADARVIADPYQHTAAVVELLRARGRQLTGTGPAAPSRRVPLPRGLLRARTG
jgi:hypothetical protein